jgi:hypothetical protein
MPRPLIPLGEHTFSHATRAHFFLSDNASYMKAICRFQIDLMIFKGEARTNNK